MLMFWPAPSVRLYDLAILRRDLVAPYMTSAFCGVNLESSLLVRHCKV